jgi:dolichol kinase
LSQALAAGVIALLVVVGLTASNFLYDRGAPESLPRRAVHTLGGAAFLLAVLWLDAWTAVALSAVLALAFVALRLSYSRGLRGVSRSDSTGDWAGIAYPAAATASLAVGWGLLGDRWLAFVPIAYMAWGDSVAGLVRTAMRRGLMGGLARATVWRVDMEIVWPSMAMLGVCLAAALLFQPYWVAALGAVVATASERFRLVAHRPWDENWVPDDPIIVAASLVVMGGLAHVTAMG